MTNFTANAGSGGATFTSDTEAGAEVPATKMMWGAAGSGQRVAAATPMPTQIGDGTNQLVLGQTTADGDAGTDWHVPCEMYSLIFNGTTWDRKRSGGVIGSTMVAGAAASGAAIAGNPILNGWTFTTTLPTVTTGQAVNAQSTARGELLVSLSSGGVAPTIVAASTQPTFASPALLVADRAQGASAAAIPSSINFMGGTFTTAMPTVTTGQLIGFQVTSKAELITSLSSGGTAIPVAAASTANPATNTALSVALSPNSPITLPTPSTSIINSAATTNATSVKATAGTVFSVTASNTGAAAAFVKLYNLATAPTVGTSTIAITIPVPAGGSVNLPFGAAGARFATGIGLSITNLGTDADATAVTAAQVKVITSYV